MVRGLWFCCLVSRFRLRGLRLRETAAASSCGMVNPLIWKFTISVDILGASREYRNILHMGYIGIISYSPSSYSPQARRGACSSPYELWINAPGRVYLSQSILCKQPTSNATYKTLHLLHHSQRVQANKTKPNTP